MASVTFERLVPEAAPLCWEAGERCGTVLLMVLDGGSDVGED